MKIPRSFTVTLGGRKLPFVYLVEDTMSGRVYGYTYVGEDKDSVDLGIALMYTHNDTIVAQFTYRCGRDAYWFKTHVKQFDTSFFEFPSVQTAIFGFKEYLAKNYVSKRASHKKKAQTMHPFGL